MIKFRRATREDVDRILEINRLSFYEDYKKYGVCPAYTETPKGLYTYITNQLIYVIVYGDKIVGNMIINVENLGFYDLEVISIHPDYHNKGIGQKAMLFIEEDNPHVKQWLLHTPHLNTRNHYFYEKLGYIKVDEFRYNDQLTMFEFRKKIMEVTHE